MSIRGAAIGGITLLLLLVNAPNVSAQTTTITDVSYTKTALFDVDTQTSNPPIIVKATIGYENARAAYYLAVGVFDLDDGNLVAGLGSSNPQPCTNGARFAGCIVPLTNQHGSEKMQFSLDHPKEVWNLALVAALLDNAKEPISESFTSYTFTINVQTALTLAVNVPPVVEVSVDGLNSSGGSVQLVLAAGNHTIGLPELVPLNDTTRLRFLDWSDGSTATNRSIELNHDITLTGNYVIQFRLQLISPVKISGAGWYDKGSTVTLSIESATLPMGGIMGDLGGRWIFEGWAQGGTEISKSPTTYVTMDSPQVVNVLWTPDYSVPLAIVAIVSLLSAFTFYPVRMRVAPRNAKRSRRRMKRYRSRARLRMRKSLVGARGYYSGRFSVAAPLCP